MARFLAWADLHNEFWGKLPDIPQACRDVDALLLGGDINTKGRHLDDALLLWSELRRPVILVRGNHEFYKSVMPDLLAEERVRLAEMNAAGADIRILDGGSTIVGDTRIVGATLWTDLDLYPGMSRPARKAVQASMNDFSQIQSRPGKHLSIDDWLEFHWNDRDAIHDELMKPFDGKTMVMTHHIAVRDMIHPLREVGAPERYVSNAGFASDIWWQFSKFNITAWFSGHSHDNRSALKRNDFGETRFLSNSRGYPKEGCEFDPAFTIET